MKFTITRINKQNKLMVSSKTVERFLERIAKDDAKLSVCLLYTSFKQRNGVTQCKLLKGVGTGKVLRECPLCVADASEFLEEILEKEGIQK